MIQYSTGASLEEDAINVPMTLGVFRDKGSGRWSMAWYEALVQRWQGAVVVVAWVAPGGILAFVAAGCVVAVVGALDRGRSRRRSLLSVPFLRRLLCRLLL